MDKTQDEICMIKIMFPVESDEQAIDYKKKISAIMSEIPEAQLHFSLIPAPARPPAV